MKKKNTSLYLVILLMVAILIGVGYAALSATLNINGRTTIEKASWDVHFENLSVTDGSVTATTPATIDANSTTVNFGVTLTNPGDFYEFTVDEVNKGTIDAMVASLVNTGLTVEQQKYLTYTVNYSDGTAVAEKQLLAANQIETIKVRVEFKKDLAAVDLPQTGTTIDLTFSLNYIQADDSAVAITHPVCKRATTLHTEVCNQSSGYCARTGYAVGDTITYGNLGTTGTLTSGDAFDCDVNGDGTFDPVTERFYYVSDLDTDNKYATLIYYNNVLSGEPNNTAAFAYDSGYESAYAGNGPVTAKLQLPTTIQWSNVSLKDTTRDIKDDTGAVRVSNFSYEGYVTRLLTYQEVNAGCYDGTTSIDSPNGLNSKCQYLMENTRYTNNSLLYGYWLEDTYENLPSVWEMLSDECRITVDSAYYDDTNGVRPAIEVLKSKISY